MLSVTKRACLLALPALAGAAMGLRPAGARADLKSVRAAGTMVIATTGTRTPWTYVDQNNRLVGYDIAWGEVICADLGVKPEWKKLDFRGMLPGLLARQFDAVMSGVTITEQRRQTFGLSEPYAYDETVAVVRAENTRVQQMADLKGLVVAAATGSEQEAVARAFGATPSDQVTPEHAALLEQMTAMEAGAEFDRQYLAAQMQGHEQLRALHAAYAENGQNPMARGASIVGVPAIDSHMSMLRAISERMG